MQWARKQKGFTIVELLIVVVVIAILAAITIVSYNGITQRARSSMAQNAVSDAKKKLEIYAINNSETYPSDLSAAGLSGSSSVAYQYSVNNSTSPKGYCVTATAGDVSYYIASNFTYTSGSTSTVNQSNPTQGVCPGHSTSGAAITNLAVNPGVEVNSSGFGGPNSSTVARNTAKSHQGVGSLLVTMPANGSSVTVGASVLTNPDVTAAFEPNKTYTASAWVWVPSSTVDITMSIQGSGRASVTNPTERTTSVKNQWTRITNTFTTAASGSIAIYVLNDTSTPATTTQFYLDDVMIVKGDTPANYADGNTPGWVWNGTPGNATSSGPAV